MPLVSTTFRRIASLACLASGICLAQTLPSTLTTLTVTAAGIPVTTITQGTVVTLTATVTSNGTNVRPGQVSFCTAAPPNCTGNNLLGTAQLTAAGTASMKLFPGTGSHTYIAAFLGTNLAAPSFASAPAVTAGAEVTTTIVSGGVPGNYELRATVSGGQTSSPISGFVTFLDTTNANYTLATASLVPEPGGGTVGVHYIASVITTCSLMFAPNGSAVGDFNQDGKPDVAYSYTARYTDPTYKPDLVGIKLGNGDGTFTDAPTLPITFPYYDANSQSVTIADVNQDGHADIIAIAGDASSAIFFVYVLLGNGDGTFVPGPYFSSNGNPIVSTGDFNGDGLPDLVLSGSGTTTVLLGNGDGTFTQSAMAAPASANSSFVDINGDGEPDVVAVTKPCNPLNGTTVVNLLYSAPPADEVATAFITGISPVGMGTHLIDASFSGDPTYPPSLSPTIALTAEPVPTSLALVASPANIFQFQPDLLTATLTPNIAQNHQATGTVTFSSGATLLTSAPLLNGGATLNTTHLPAGNDMLTATYSGDTNFLPSTSPPFTVAVTPVDFTLVLASPSLTLPTQHHLTTSLTLTSINGFTDSLTLACLNAPAYVTCRFTPATASLAANTTTVSLYIDTDAVLGFVGSNRPPAPMRLSTPANLALLLSPVSFAFFSRRRTRSRLLTLLLAVTLIPIAFAFTGCGEVILPPPSATPGVYTLQVTATGTNTGVSHAAPLTLTITPSPPAQPH